MSDSVGDDPEPDEAALRAADDAIEAEIAYRVDADIRFQAEVAERQKHCLTVLRTAGVPIDDVTAMALHHLAAHLQAIFEELVADV